MSILKLINLSKTFSEKEGRVVDNVSLEMEQGEILALLGESGSGKTTVLRMIAGFEPPSSGEVHIDGKLAAGNGTFIMPEKRGVGVVFQDYALFPHLTVRQNMEFGLKGLDSGLRSERINEMMEITGTKMLAKRYPHELSGGQKQRIALARAMAPRPGLILMDEPFSSIDSMLKNQMRKEIRAILKKTGTTALFVTHDTRDALVLCDRICMLRNGKNIQTGTPDELYNTPVNAYVANFFGKTNLIRAQVTSDGLKTSFGLLPLIDKKRSRGETVMVSIRPENFVIKNSTDDCICGDIVDESFMGDYNELVCEVNTGEGNREQLLLRVSPGNSCDTRQCWFKPRKGGIHILDDKPPDTF